MKEKRKVTIYPCENECYDMVKFMKESNSHLYPEYIVSLKGLRVQDKDIGYLENRKDLGHKISGDLYYALNNSDTFLIAPVLDDKEYREIILKDIKRAINLGKDIICTMHLNKEELSYISKNANKSGVKFEYLYNDRNIYLNKETVINETKKKNSLKKLYRPEIPVIFIGETFLNSRSLEILLDVKRKFENEGYIVSAISNLHYGEFYNTISFPRFFFQNSISVNLQALRFNSFIEGICSIEKPDVIIVEMPDAMINYDDFITNGFGIYPYIISQVLSPDFFILVDNCGEMPNQYYQEINKMFRKRYGYGIDIVCITNCILDYNTSESKGKPVMRKINYSNVVSVINKNIHDVIPVIDGTDNNPELKIIQMINEKLG